ncbi:MAG: hypothetical protein ACP5MT_00535 [Candidatus Acidifodinimicrobium sp.]
MSPKAVLLCLHGYTKYPKEREKDWQKVVKGRLYTAYEIAKFFSSINVTTYVKERLMKGMKEI